MILPQEQSVNAQTKNTATVQPVKSSRLVKSCTANYQGKLNVEHKNLT